MITKWGLAAVFVSVSAINGCHKDVGAGASRAAPGTFPFSVALVVDLGVIPAGSSIRHIVPFTNVSDDTRRVSAIFTSCSCLKVIAAKHTLAPCENSYLEIALNMNDKPCSVGVLSFQVDGCDENNSKIMSFDVRARVVPKDELKELSAF
jgi:Protein of unknown function (DUF1573)